MEIKRKEYITPPETFGKNGYKYKLVKFQAIEGFVKVLYLQHKNEETYGFEVMKLKLNKNGKFKLPNNNDFGTYAWSFQSYPEALSKFNVIHNTLDK